MFFRAEKSDKGMKIISGECLEIKSIDSFILLKIPIIPKLFL